MVLLLFVSFIFVDIYIAAKTLQRNKTDIDSNDLLMKHLELHQYHCGEIATCGSSEHVEPSEFLIPAPCCIPCSCLPSCVEQLSCCPISVNGTLSEPTTSELDDIVQENEKNETDDGLIFVRKGVESWNKNDENKAGLHKLGELHIATSTGLNNRDSGALKINEINRKNEKCIRPQVFYEPNRYIDAQAYMMVVTCPEVFKDKLIIDKCSAGKDQVALLDMIPVTSQLSGLTYKNKYCLMCNEKLQPDHVIEWRAEIVSKGAMREHIFFANPNAIADMLIGKETAFSNIHFVPVVKDLTKACKTYDIISCNQTGLWDMYNDLKETVCLEGHILPIMSTINGKLLTFKNIGCLHCNMRKDFSKSRLTCRYWRNQLGPEATFSLTLNLRRLVPDGQSKKPMLSAPYIEHDVLLQLQHRRCPAGKVYLLGRCRGITCPRDHYILDNQCVPLYDTLTGLDLNIQIQITPSEEIPGDISEAFVDNLKQMADEVLSNTVRLEQRQTSLWHLPRSNVNPTEYYMLNVFLFNRSDVIKYSAAIDEIRQFFRKMKTGVKLSILEPSDIKLTFQFKHGLELSRDKYMDMSNGQIHKPLMEKDWTLMYPSPYMTISDVTWCLRTVFDLSEFEEFAFYIIVKSTDNIVFIDQYDRQENQCFVCIDLFIELTHVEEDSQIIREGKPASEDDKEMSVEVVVDSTRGLIVTVTLIAVILLLVILYKVKSAMTRKQFEESDNRSNHTPDFVELNVISS